MPLMARLLASARNDQRGFTLMETLVAMLTGLVVIGALFAILETSVKQTSRLSQLAQATQTGNIAMTHIVDELHSACLAEGFAPVQKGSTASKLILQDGYFPEKIKEAGKEPEYSFVRQDTIEYSPSESRLTDSTLKASGEAESGVYPTSKSTATSVLLAEKVSEVEAKSEPAVFKYWTYATSSTTSTSEAAATLQLIKASEIGSEGLTSAQAKAVAAVSVSFSTAPSEKKEVRLTTAAESGLPNALSTETVFAFNAPNSEAKVTAGPCE